MEFKIGSHWVGNRHSTYFIADIAANHDGDLQRAKLLIRLAKDAGAHAAKFQNFSGIQDRRIMVSPVRAGSCPTNPPGKSPFTKFTPTLRFPLSGLPFSRRSATGGHRLFLLAIRFRRD